jgi:hypothetical protein
MEYFHETAIGVIYYGIVIIHTQDDRYISLRHVIIKYFLETAIVVIEYIMSL